MEYRIVEKEAFRVVGVKRNFEKDTEVCFREIPLFWGEVATSGKLPQIAGLMNQEPMGVLGISAYMDHLEEWEYYIAVASDIEVPEGMVEYIVPASTWAVFQGQLSVTGSIQEVQKRVVTEWLPTSGYTYASVPDVEVYLDPDPINGKFEVWLPVVK